MGCWLLAIGDGIEYDIVSRVQIMPDPIEKSLFSKNTILNEYLDKQESLSRLPPTKLAWPYTWNAEFAGSSEEPDL